MFNISTPTNISNLGLTSFKGCWFFTELICVVYKLQRHKDSDSPGVSSRQVIVDFEFYTHNKTLMIDVWVKKVIIWNQRAGLMVGMGLMCRSTILHDQCDWKIKLLLQSCLSSLSMGWENQGENTTNTLGLMGRHFTLFTLVITVAWQAKVKYSTKYKVMTVKNEIELPLHLHILVSACLCTYMYVWRVQGLPATDFVIDIIYYQHVPLKT